MLVLGIDPGAKTSGLVLRTGDELRWHGLAWNPDPDVSDFYLEQVLRTVGQGLAEAANGALLAIEDVVVPNPHLGLANVSGILGTAQVLGAIRAEYRHHQIVIVPPAKHGQGPLAAYPTLLVGPREGPSGRGRLRHCRSAWDCAAAGLTLYRIATTAV